MSTSNDNEDGGDASENVGLAGRLRNPGVGQTEIEPHEEEEDEAVDRLSERFREKKSRPEQDGPSLDEQSSNGEDVESEQLENFLLDALDSEEEAEGEEPTAEAGDQSTEGRPNPRTPKRDTDTGIGNSKAIRADGTSPGTNEPTGTSTDTGTQAPTAQRTDGGGQKERSQVEKSEKAGQICPSCQAVSPSGMRFCVQCGTSLRQNRSRSGEAGRQKQTESVDPNKLDSQIPAGFELVAINDDGTDGKAIAIHSAQTIMGRDGDARFPTDEFLDPKHARLTVEGGGLFIEDLDTLNGTFLKLRGEVRLKPGDTFLMGRQVLSFQRLEREFDAQKTASDGTRFMGSPAPGGDYKLLQIGVGDIIQNIYCLPKTGVVLGREKGDIIFPRDKFMSGRHARIITEDKPYLTDLNSSNGTWIKLWDKSRLEEGDYIFMGQQLFRVEIPG
jgi:pSer/pThr/pTyr-binding forkhead associated (FHA) protein